MFERRSAVSGQRSAVSGQRSAVSGQRSAVSGQRSAVSGHLKMEAKLRFFGVNVNFKLLFINNLHVINLQVNFSRQPTADSRQPFTSIFQVLFGYGI